MESNKYAFQMERSENILLNIDHRQMGVGGNNSWGALPLKPYRLADKAYDYSYRIRPITADQSVDQLMNTLVKAFPVDFSSLQAPEATPTVKPDDVAGPSE